MLEGLSWALKRDVGALGGAGPPTAHVYSKSIFPSFSPHGSHKKYFAGN